MVSSIQNMGDRWRYNTSGPEDKNMLGGHGAGFCLAAFIVTYITAEEDATRRQVELKRMLSPRQEITITIFGIYTIYSSKMHLLGWTGKWRCKQAAQKFGTYARATCITQGCQCA